ncbi:MAG: hypothetical protein V7707_16715 [Motiliproteus sp.]
MNIFAMPGSIKTAIKRVALLGFDGPSQASIKLFFAKQPELSLVQPELAELLVVNGDQGLSPEQLFSDYLERYGRPGVLISARELQWPGFVLLKKPYSSSELIGAIAQSEDSTYLEQIRCALDSTGVKEPLPSVAMVEPASAEPAPAVIDLRTDAFGDYKARVDAGLDAMQRLQEAKQQQGQKQALLKQRLHEGREASRLAAKSAVAQMMAVDFDADADVRVKQPVKTKITPPSPDKAPAYPASELESIKPLEELHLLPPSAPQPRVVKMDQSMINRCCGHHPDVNVRNPQQRRGLYFNASGAFLNWLPRAVNKARLSQLPVEIAGLPCPLIYLPEEDCFWGDFDQELLLQYALSRFGMTELELRNRPDLEMIKPVARNADPIHEPRDALIWKMALWSTRGRLSQHLDPEAVYTLVAKPDFSRLLAIPHAEDITELWHQQCFSAVNVIRMLQVPQRYVFAYMSAADALGWLQR